MPVKNLTEKGVERMPPPNGHKKQTVISDQTMPNLILKVGKRTKTFFWDGSTPSGRRQIKLGRFPALSVSDAREACRKKSQAVLDGLDPTAPDTDNMTGQELFDECIQSVQFRDRADVTVDTQESYLRRGFLPMCGKMLIKHINSGHVMDMTNAFLNQGKRAAAGHMHAALAALFKYAIQRRYIDRHPMFGISPPKACKPKDRVLSDEELKKVWFALDETKRLSRPNEIAIRLLIVLPFRGIELIGAKWTEINFNEANWLVPASRIKTKNSNPQPFLMPLPPLALALLRELHDITGEGDYLFPAPRAQDRPVDTKVIGRFINRNLEKGVFEGMEKWAKHDLRRTTATNMGMLGIDELIISRCLNHKIRSITTQVYNLYGYREEKLEALIAWEKHLRSILGLAKTR